jgi:hypothetical protein
MDYKIHRHGTKEITEIHTQGVQINDAQAFLEIMMNAPSERLVIWQKSLGEEFFNLRSGLAGEILQKVVNYRMRLAIVGDFSGYASKSLHDFIYESNRGGVIVFTATIEEALSKLGS